MWRAMLRAIGVGDDNDPLIDLDSSLCKILPAPTANLSGSHHWLIAEDALDDLTMASGDCACCGGAQPASATRKTKAPSNERLRTGICIKACEVANGGSSTTAACRRLQTVASKFT